MEAADSLPVTAAERWSYAARQVGAHALLVSAPFAVVSVIVAGLRNHALAFDFHQAYLPAAHAVLAGHSPYPPATVAALTPRTAFVYPPLTAYLAAPFAALPPQVADAVATALAIACIAGILMLLGITDWRCYAMSFLWAPTYSAIQTANVTLLLAVGLALVWRLRNRAVAVAFIGGLLIALKLFLWPVMIWLLATRRIRGAAGGILAGAVLIVVPWAGIGFAGMAGYPHLLNVMSRVERSTGYTVPALLSGGFSWGIAEAAGIAAGLVVLAAAVRLGGRDERRSFGLAIAATLLLTPVFSLNYFVFLLVIVALFVPRLSWVWGLPLLFWLSPQVGNGHTWQTALALAVAGVTFTLAMRTQRTAGSGSSVLAPTQAVHEASL
jgi:alpha-1,2-mannosyltransferase